MAKKETSRTRKKAFTAKDLGMYVNLLTDFGFMVRHAHQPEDIRY